MCYNIYNIFNERLEINIPVFSFCMGAFLPCNSMARHKEREVRLLEKEKRGRNGNTADRVRELALPLCEEMGLFLWDVRFEKEGATWYLRIFIDKDEGVDMNDCEEFTRAFNTIIDEADPVSQSYVMEIGSPGLGRELRRPEHFEACINELIRVRLIRPRSDGEREFIVGLDSFDKEKIYCHYTNDEGMALDAVEFTFKECASIKLYDDGDLF